MDVYSAYDARIMVGTLMENGRTTWVFPTDFSGITGRRSSDPGLVDGGDAMFYT
jgi:hypothetical protein